MGRGLRSVAGGAMVAVALGLPAAAQAAWPGENGEIWFASGRGAGGDASADIYRLSGPLGTVSSPVTPNLIGQHRHPDVSPDGSELAFALFTSAGDRDIWTVPTETTGASPLRDTADQQEDRPAYSPDGKFLAYESEEPPTCGEASCDEFDIYVTEVANPANTFNLTAGTPTLDQGKPVWSHDGEFIYYQHEFSATDQDIQREASDGSDVAPTNILNSATNEYQASLSPNGSEMCFTRGGAFGSAETDVYKLSPVEPGGTQTDISDNPGAAAGDGDFNCAFSPDGEFIAYARGIFGGAQLQFEDADDADAVDNSSPLTTEDEVGAANDNGVFDGNPYWARVPLECKNKRADIVGTINDETLPGTSDPEVIVGLQGKDRIPARKGNDIVCGNSAADKLFGAKGRDKMFGGPGGDEITGGDGNNDVCFGGPGQDTFKECEEVHPN
jgi:Tol biopolymer transport system component